MHKSPQGNTKGLVPVADSSASLRSFMSTVPRDDDEDDDWFQFTLPPPPEDEMILMGDLMSIFVYGFADHWICHDLAQAADPVDAALATHPVWLDHSHAFAPTVLQVVHDAQSVTQYSPLLQDAGAACCVMASAWLLGGWLQGAFLTRNTLDCSTQRALQVTAQAWLVTCAIMAYVVATTSWLNDAILQAPLEWNGFTKGDADYILDSLIVIAAWRWLASYLMGRGGRAGK